MRVALVNPSWDFANSIYFGCREPHLPLELGYARARLETRRPRGADAGRTPVRSHQRRPRGGCRRLRAGHDAWWRPRPPTCSGAARRRSCACPAPSSKRSAPSGGRTVAIGPHGSVTPETTLRKLRRRRRGARRMRGDPAAPGLARAGSPTCPRSPSGRRTRCASPAARTPSAFTDEPRCAGRRTGSHATTTIITASMAGRAASAPKWRARAAARITAPSAPRSTSATATGAATSRPCSPRSTPWWPRASATSTSSTRSSCPTRRCSRR